MASIGQIKMFARIFNIEEDLASDCLVFLHAMPQWTVKQFKESIMKFDESFDDQDVRTQVAVKEWLDLQLEIKEECKRRNTWSRKIPVFWNAILKPTPLGRTMLEKFILTFSKKEK